MVSVADALINEPALVVPTFGLVFVAMLMSLCIHTLNMSALPITALGIILSYALIWVGWLYPVTMPASWSPQTVTTAWCLVLSLYCLLASVSPIWLLLQPRDFISSIKLFVGAGPGIPGRFHHPSPNQRARARGRVHARRPPPLARPVHHRGLRGHQRLPLPGVHGHLVPPAGPGILGPCRGLRRHAHRRRAGRAGGHDGGGGAQMGISARGNHGTGPAELVRPGPQGGVDRGLWHGVWQSHRAPRHPVPDHARGRAHRHGHGQVLHPDHPGLRNAPGTLPGGRNHGRAHSAVQKKPHRGHPWLFSFPDSSWR